MVSGEVSFVVPTYNEEGFVGDCLSLIRSQDRCREVIVVDGGSSDGTLEEASEFADKIIEGVEGRGKSRHRGAEESEGEFIAFVDADTMVSEDYCDEMVELFSEDSIVAATSRFNITGFRSELIRLTCEKLLMRGNPLIPGFNCFVERESYFDSGGFDDVPAEDLQFSKKISREGEVGVHPERLATTSGRRVKRFGLTGSLVYYLGKDLKRRFRKREMYFPLND